ncbi:hypothetical protein A7K69_17955 [Parageobacillus thermoglucosidasius]|uniref:Uncharacterized protein n=1 Tax=Parageobacillus thermoglucosidasius TaxID=1426 RepID=A0A1B7KUL1_PARTM|nr:hypothetical protein A7K69_17955 [Parageobacillus thermoglucosidasius]
MKKWFKKIEATDCFFVMLFLSWLSEVDFDEMTILRWITLVVVVIWFILIAIKYKLKFEGEE